MQALTSLQQNALTAEGRRNDGARSFVLRHTNEDGRFVAHPYRRSCCPRIETLAKLHIMGHFCPHCNQLYDKDLEVVELRSYVDDHQDLFTKTAQAFEQDNRDYYETTPLGKIVNAAKNHHIPLPENFAKMPIQELQEYFTDKLFLLLTKDKQKEEKEAPIREEEKPAPPPLLVQKLQEKQVAIQEKKIALKRLSFNMAQTQVLLIISLIATLIIFEVATRYHIF